MNSFAWLHFLWKKWHSSPLLDHSRDPSRWLGAHLCGIWVQKTPPSPSLSSQPYLGTHHFLQKAPLHGTSIKTASLPPGTHPTGLPRNSPLPVSAEGQQPGLLPAHLTRAAHRQPKEGYATPRQRSPEDLPSSWVWKHPPLLPSTHPRGFCEGRRRLTLRLRPLPAPTQRMVLRAVGEGAQRNPPRGTLGHRYLVQPTRASLPPPAFPRMRTCCRARAVRNLPPPSAGAVRLRAGAARQRRAPEVAAAGVSSSSPPSRGRWLPAPGWGEAKRGSRRHDLRFGELHQPYPSGGRKCPGAAPGAAGAGLPSAWRPRAWGEAGCGAPSGLAALRAGRRLAPGSGGCSTARGWAPELLRASGTSGPSKVWAARRFPALGTVLKGLWKRVGRGLWPLASRSRGRLCCLGPSCLVVSVSLYIRLAWQVERRLQETQRIGSPRTPGAANLILAWSVMRFTVGLAS